MKKHIVAIVSLLILTFVIIGASAIGFGNNMVCNDDFDVVCPLKPSQSSVQNTESSSETLCDETDGDKALSPVHKENTEKNSCRFSFATNFLKALKKFIEAFARKFSETPAVTTPPVTVPQTTTPPDTAPPITTPPVTTSSITSPQVTTTTVTTPPAPPPPVTTPPVTTTTVTAPPMTAPPPTTTLPVTTTTVTAPPVTTPPQTTAPPVTTTTTTSNVSFASQVADLVNAERAKAGLAPLTFDSALTNLAQLKSQDMHDLKYFDHTSPTYGSPFEMMKQFGISYRCAGENIAYGYKTPEAVMTGWMNSPGHKANILNPNFTKIGVGFVTPGNYWTQMFIG